MNKGKLKRVLLFTVSVFILSGLFAQDESGQKLSFSLEEATQYALENNETLKNASLEVLNARKKVLETTAIGLPQASAAFNYTYMITVPEAIEQFSSFNELPSLLYGLSATMDGMTKTLADLNPGTWPADLNWDNPLEAPAGGDESDPDALKKTITLDITVSQLIFSGEYIVGLQASRTYKRLSELLYNQSKTEVAELVTNSYFTVLMAEENLAVLDSIEQATSQTLYEISEMQKEGFVEDTDVDQLRLTLQTIQNAKKSLERQVEVSYKLLKFQMGMDVNEIIELSDNLNGLVQAMDTEALILQNFDVTSNVNYQLLETQVDLMELDLKRYQSQYLPTVAAFYQHQENYNDQAFTFTPPDLIGFNVSLPLFTSGQRIAKVSQARIAVEKAQNTKQQATNGLMLEYSASLTAYKTAIDTYNSQKDNADLAYTIYSKTLTKYREGISSSLDLSQAQSQYLQAQSDYYVAILEMINAQSKLQKLLTKN